MSKRITCHRCRQDRVNEARGLCKSCTRFLRETDQLDLYPPLERQRTEQPQPEPDDDAFPGAWVRRGHVYYPVQAAS